ncbi:MAG TPA: hypothetical protein VEJ87_14220, partial [Acidimicrobiales bacterium]|nr:hypothetical protein [Acidimicrobiales bacterium]
RIRWSLTVPNTALGRTRADAVEGHFNHVTPTIRSPGARAVVVSEGLGGILNYKAFVQLYSSG